MKIIFHETIDINNDLKIASAKILFSITDRYVPGIPREREKIVYNDECYKIVNIFNVFEYCHLEKCQELDHIDIFVKKL